MEKAEVRGHSFLDVNIKLRLILTSGCVHIRLVIKLTSDLKTYKENFEKLKVKAHPVAAIRWFTYTLIPVNSSTKSSSNASYHLSAEI